MCGEAMRGRTESRLLFYCNWTKRVWGKAMEVLNTLGVRRDSPQQGERAGAPGEGWQAPQGIKARKVWRKWWACVVWAIWRSWCDVTHRVSMGALLHDLEACMALAQHTAVKCWHAGGEGQEGEG